MKYIDADLLRKEIERIMSRAMNKEGQDVCNYILSIIDSSQKYSLPEWEEHPEATNNIAMVWNAAATPWLDWRGHRISVRSLEKLPGFDSLQQEQPCDTCTNDKGCVTCKDGELWEGKEQSCEDLEEAAKQYHERIQFSSRPSFYDAFIAGAEWQKEQMLQLATNRYEMAMTFVSGNLDVDHALQMDGLALVKIIEEDKK